jgi:hypothetical protein
MARPADTKKDQHLINILTANARTSVSDVAKALGASDHTANFEAQLCRRRDSSGTNYLLQFLQAVATVVENCSRTAILQRGFQIKIRN